MATEALVSDGEIVEARRLVSVLDAAGYQVPLVMWSRGEDDEEANLYLAMREADIHGFVPVYRKLLDVIAALHDRLGVDWPRIRLKNTYEQDVISLRCFAGTPGAPYLSGSFLRNKQVGESTFTDTLVMRAERFFPVEGRCRVSVVERVPGQKRPTFVPAELTFAESRLVEVEHAGRTFRPPPGLPGVTWRGAIMLASFSGREQWRVLKIAFRDGELRMAEATGYPRLVSGVPERDAVVLESPV